MNILFLLAAAIVLLLMGRRFWGRILAAGPFRPLAGIRAPGNDTNPGFDLAENGHVVAAAGGALAAIGAGLALIWGWAPVYVWLLVACALLSGLTAGALSWTAAAVARGPLEATAAVLGDGFAAGMRLALVVVLAVWVPVSAAMAAALVTRYPLALGPLLAQALVALILGLAPRPRPGGPTLLAALVAVVAAVPAGYLAALWLTGGDLTWMDGAAMRVGAALVVAAVALSGGPPRRFLAPFGFQLAVVLAAVMVLAAVSLGASPVEVGYLPYHRPDPGPGALPLLLIAASFGLAPLLVMLRDGQRREQVSGGASVPAWEGLVAILVLCAFLAAPSTVDALPTNLPHWVAGIDPGATAVYAVQSIAALAEPLGISGRMAEAVVAALLAGLVLAFLALACGTFAANVAAFVPAGAGGPALVTLAPAVLLVGLTLAALAAGRLPVDLWLAAGEAALLLTCGALAAAAFAAARLKRSPWPSLAPAVALSALLAWALASQLARCAADGRWGMFAAHFSVAVAATWLATIATARFQQLAGLRRVAKQH